MLIRQTLFPRRILRIVAHVKGSVVEGMGWEAERRCKSTRKGFRRGQLDTILGECTDRLTRQQVTAVAILISMLGLSTGRMPTSAKPCGTGVWCDRKHFVVGRDITEQLLRRYR